MNKKDPLSLVYLNAWFLVDCLFLKIRQCGLVGVSLEVGLDVTKAHNGAVSLYLPAAYESRWMDLSGSATTQLRSPYLKGFIYKSCLNYGMCSEQ